MNLRGVLAGTVAACLFTPTPAANVNANLGLRTLVIHNGPEDLQLARVVVSGHAAPFDAFPKTSLPPMDSPKWHSVVVMSCDTNTLQFVRQYTRKYGVRLVCLHSPDGSTATSDLGVSVTSYGGERAVAFDGSPFGRSVADVMNVETTHDLNKDAHTPVSYTITNTTTTRPVLRYTNAAKGPEQTIGNTGVAAFVSSSGNMEEMHYAFKAWAHELCPTGGPCLTDLAAKPMNFQYSRLAMALGNVWFQWVTRGVYIGKRRVYLQLHIDDYFQQNLLHDGTNLRITYGDVQQNAEWARTAAARHNLPAGSAITLEMAYNGFAHSAADYDAQKPNDKGLRKATEDFLEDFNWVSHTWTHNHMDYLGSWNCDGKAFTCRTPRERNRLELLYNQNLATGVEVPALLSGDNNTRWDYSMGKTPCCNMFYQKQELAKKRYSPSCLVTPEVSGLYPVGFNGERGIAGNQDVLVPMIEAGIKTVVGDNSRWELNSKESVHHGVWVGKDNYGVDNGPLIIPRAAVSIAYQAADPALWVKWYNDLRACENDFGPRCKNGTNYTFDEAMARNTEIGLFYLLQYRADAFMFHQTNIHFTPYNGNNISLTTYWADRVLGDYSKYVKGLPITSPRMENAGEIFRERMAMDKCGLAGTVQVVDGVWKQLSLEAKDGNCNASVSTSQLSGLSIDLPNKETYGPDSTYRVPMQKGQKVSYALKMDPDSLEQGTNSGASRVVNGAGAPSSLFALVVAVSAMVCGMAL